MKIAFVVQRYGLETLGGAETQARMIAEKLVSRGMDVTVLTTTAKNHLTWDNEYPEGSSSLNGVKVRRFFVKRRRPRLLFKIYHHSVKNILKHHKWLTCVYPLIHFLDRLWFFLQGPRVKEMYTVLDDYDCCFFFTYLYAPTVTGLPKVAGKSVLIPEAHDEEPFYFPSIERLFRASKYVLFNTAAEKQLAESQGYLGDCFSWIVGCGVELCDPVRLQAQAVRPFLLFMGRFDEKKGLSTLLEQYRLYRNLSPDPIDLVLIGEDGVDFDLPGVRVLGFVSSEKRDLLLNDATAVISFSQQESLSLVVLEALWAGKPVILGATCQVFEDYAQQVPLVKLCRTPEDFCSLVELATRGYSSACRSQSQDWVRQHYGWDRVLTIYKSLASNCVDVAQSH